MFGMLFSCITFSSKALARNYKYSLIYLSDNASPYKILLNISMQK